MEGRVDRVEDCAHGASIEVEGQEYAGRWVFDSRFRLADFHPDPSRYRYLKMQARGWEIETDDPHFDTSTATFLDFRTTQRGQMRFLYVRPYTERRALGEHVACTRTLLHRDEEEDALREYIRDILGVERYRVVCEEQGANPMTDYRFPRHEGHHVMSIGIRAGMLKLVAGFAFTRIQRDSHAIVRSLVERGEPPHVLPSRPAYRFCDSLLLWAMARYGEQTASLLTTFFKYGAPERILRFLDERGAPI